MLRWTLALVVVANLLYLAWARHWLAPLGLTPETEGEPYRMQQQLHPEAIVLRPARPAAAITSRDAALSAAGAPGAAAPTDANADSAAPANAAPNAATPAAADPALAGPAAAPR